MVFGFGRCNNKRHKRFKLHWTRRAQAECDDRMERINRPIDTRVDRTLERERKQQELDAAVDQHVPVAPTNSHERAVLRNGERQLVSGVEDLYTLLDLLVMVEIHDVNSRLRRSQSLEGAAGPLIDLAGYPSRAKFVEDVRRMFTAIGTELNLDEPMKVYRGLGLPPLNEDDQVDFWNLRAFLRGEATLTGQLLTDPGISFASLNEDTARGYPLRNTPDIPEVESRVMLELTVCRGLCLPAPEHRSKDLFGRLYRYWVLPEAVGQVVIPPDTTWRVTSAEPADTTGWARIALEQVLP